MASLDLLALRRFSLSLLFVLGILVVGPFYSWLQLCNLYGMLSSPRRMRRTNDSCMAGNHSVAYIKPYLQSLYRSPRMPKDEEPIVTPPATVAAEVKVVKIWEHPMVIITAVLAAIPTLLVVLVQLKELPGLPTNVLGWITAAIGILTLILTIAR